MENKKPTMKEIFLEEALSRRGLSLEDMNHTKVSAFVWTNCDGEECKRIFSFEMAPNGALTEINT